MCICKLPQILRARGLYVYDDKAKRYLDFHLDNSRLALGHRVTHQLKLIKSVLSRGLYANYPCVYEQRLKRAFIAFFGSDIVVHGFRSSSLVQAFLRERYACSHLPFFWQEEAVVLGRARWKLGAKVEDCSFLLWEMEPPLPSFLGYIRFFVERKVGLKASSLQLWGEPWDPFTMRLSEQALYALVRERSLPFIPPASHVGEGLWERYEQIWLPRYDRQKHTKIWQTFIEKGVILPLSYEKPLIISKNLQKQDWKLFEKAQRAYLEKT